MRSGLCYLTFTVHHIGQDWMVYSIMTDCFEREASPLTRSYQDGSFYLVQGDVDRDIGEAGR